MAARWIRGGCLPTALRFSFYTVQSFSCFLLYLSSTFSSGLFSLASDYVFFLFLPLWSAGGAVCHLPLQSMSWYSIWSRAFSVSLRGWITWRQVCARPSRFLRCHVHLQLPDVCLFHTLCWLLHGRQPRGRVKCPLSTLSGHPLVPWQQRWSHWWGHSGIKARCVRCYIDFHWAFSWEETDYEFSIELFVWPIPRRVIVFRLCGR